MPIQQPPSPLDNIPKLQPAGEQQEKLEERLSETYVPKVVAFLIKQQKVAIAMRRKLIF